MYNEHFGFASAPFRLLPDTGRFFAGGQRAAVLDTLLYAISAGEGVIKVTGEVGSGKTTLCRMLQMRLPAKVVSVYLDNPRLDAGELMQAIALELRLPLSAQATSYQLHRQIQTHLLEVHRQGRQVVVFVEEAQQMPLESLEALRLLSNLETSHAKLLQLVLFGQPEFDLYLQQHAVRQFKDRVSHSFHLRALTRAQVRDYLHFRLQRAGYTGASLFTAAACRQLAWSSRGLIRRLHLLADKALLAAFADGRTRVGWRDVRRARDDDRPPASGLVRRFAPHGLVPGLLAGLSLALGISGYGWLPSANDNPVPEPHSQKIDELRAVAQQIHPAAGVRQVSARLQATREWLAQTQRGFTIQLLLSHDDDLGKLEKLFENKAYQTLLSDLYLLRSRVKGAPRWSLMYGSFASRSKALQQMAALPESVRRQRPYLRSIATLRAQHQAAGQESQRDLQG